MEINTEKSQVRIALMILVIILVGGLFLVALHRIKVDTDIVGALPQMDNVISDARYIMLNHPAQDQLVIDVRYQKDAPDILVEAGNFIERRLGGSGLFERVGMRESLNLLPELISHIVRNLPLMFSEKELKIQVQPLLRPREVHQRLGDSLSSLQSIEGIGQAEMISRDPLGLRNLVMARLRHLAPPQDARIYGGQLISANGKHLLIIAKPSGSGTDTAFSRMAMALIDDLGEELNKKYAEPGCSFTLTPVGAFRAALDNELLAKSDARRAIIFSTLGIALLLIFAFPRPLIGLLAFLPAIAGTIIAFFTYSLFHKSISILTLGFGGAIISITVDHGLAYLLFLDRPYKAFGQEASREVWAVGLVATLTTVGAFAILPISGFPVLSQIGQFTALGIAASFLFVHTIFPLIFPVMFPPKRKRPLPIQGLVNKMALKGGRYKAYAALAFALFMLYFARPEFHVDIKSMNTVSRETRAAEGVLRDVWGDIFSRIYIATNGSNLEELQETGDRLSSLFEDEVASGALTSSFIPSMVFPGGTKGRQNLTAWRKFWNGGRVTRLKRSIEEASLDLGFSENAFQNFFKTIHTQNFDNLEIPERLFPLLGIARDRYGSGWVQFATVTPGDAYDARRFYSDCAATGPVRIFDPNLFSERLGQLLYSTFLKMLLIIGSGAVLLLFIFFFDWVLTLVALLPISFALVCTLGTLKLMGHPLDIPGLMLSIVVVGMGIDYSIFFVRSYQRYIDESNPSIGIIRMAVFLAGASTMIGFGVLAFATHSMLKSAGLTSFLGIAYSFVGAFAILPPILKHLFGQVELPVEGAGPDTRKGLAIVVRRYRHLEAYPRLWVRIRATFDPMFYELPRFLDSPKVVIEIGSGYGLSALWVLHLFPKARVYGIEPDRERARIASRVIGKGGSIEHGSLPAIPMAPDLADAAIVIDSIDNLGDQQLKSTLKGLYEQLRHGGSLIIRASIWSEKGGAWLQRIGNIRDKILGITSRHRSAHDTGTIIAQAGFGGLKIAPSGSGRRRTWFLAKAIKE